MFRNRFTHFSLTLQQVLFCLVIVLSSAADNRASGGQQLSIIPQPVSVKIGSGDFLLSDKTTISIDVDQAIAPNVRSTVALFVDQIEQSTGIDIKAAEGNARKDLILFKQLKQSRPLPNGGYLLDVAAKSISVYAKDSAGFFYATQTLLQMMPVDVFSSKLVDDVQWGIPCVKIRDYPRFGWRGIMLDASRHFQSIEYVKRYIDLMAMHKLNVFHWHLVDGHGWRIEIKKYPELTKVSAWRNQPGYSEAHGPYGGFYTQDEIRDVVAYAAERHITVVPEIEMPGHSWEVFAAYLHLSCTEEKQEVAYFFTYPADAQRFPSMKGSDVFCAGKEGSFEFLQNVLVEVFELFPSKYIHVGGDEVDKKWWQKCERCQARIKAEGLDNEHELQSYFIQRMEKFLNSHGRKLIGWDEILEGGLAEDATVMSWRGTTGGIKAAKMGHDVVMTPQKPLYFDHGQSTDPMHPPHWPGVETIEEVYAYEPIPAELTAAQAKHVLGAQANMWTVFTHTGELIDLQTYPRACALSETVWSAKDVRNWDGFSERLRVHKKRLDVLGVNYYVSSSVEVGNWQPDMVSENRRTLTFDVTDVLDEPGVFDVGVNYSKGAHGLDIYEVALLAEGEVVSKDRHEGFTGWANRNNKYRVESPGAKPGVPYQLQITVASSGGTDSHGSVFMSRVEEDDADTVTPPTEDPPCGPLHPLLAEVIETGPYEPQWASLITHPVADWFLEDKVGLSAHWGPYAVPGWTPRKDTPYGVAYAEWYWMWLQGNEAVKAHHKKHYGDADYDDFIDGTKNLVTGETEGFYAKNFDADRWMRTFKDAGVKYFFITSKHHDGFCIWDSQYTDRNAMKMGPRRDLYGEMVEAARRHGLKIGLYYSFYEWFNPIYRQEDDITGYKGIKKLSDEDGDGNSNEYVDDFMIPQIKELIDKYRPDYLCFDGEWDHGYPYWRARQIVAYYYNQAAARGQKVVINDRFGQAKEGVSDTRGIYGDFRHVEYYADVDKDLPWAMWRGFGNSYGYNKNEHPDNILSKRAVVHMVIDCVANNGNIEFNIGPKADGTLAEFELERLEAMGKWLSVNGQAVYGTTKGVFKNLPWGRSTTKGNTVYLHVFDWPSDGTLVLQGLMTQVKKAYLLHDPHRRLLSCTKDDRERLLIDLSGHTPFEYASVVALELASKPEVNNRIHPDESGRVVLSASRADLKGGLQVESVKGSVTAAAGTEKDVTLYNIGFWTNDQATAQWDLQLDKNKKYHVEIEWACAPGHEGGSYTLRIGDETFEAKVENHTGAWQAYSTTKLGTLKTGNAARVAAVLSAKMIPAGKAMMNVRSIVLTEVR